MKSVAKWIKLEKGTNFWEAFSGNLSARTLFALYERDEDGGSVDVKDENGNKKQRIYDEKLKQTKIHCSFAYEFRSKEQGNDNSNHPKQQDWNPAQHNLLNWCQIFKQIHLIKSKTNEIPNEQVFWKDPKGIPSTFWQIKAKTSAFSTSGSYLTNNKLWICCQILRNLFLWSATRVFFCVN